MGTESYRLGAFLAVFGLLALWEAAAPRRRSRFNRSERWPHNLLLLGIDVAVLRILAPGASLAVAIAAEANGWGLLRELPQWMAVIAAVLVLDLVVYFQHVTFHAVPALWRLHRVHHSDLDVDLTTGSRFHPIALDIHPLAK
jgi:sterol desaturase/sphingolipid hydroxylase (fatty acid hydroxylase superfamily)